MPLTYEELNGKKYTLINYSGLQGEALAAEVKKVTAEGKNNNTGKKAKVLIDITNSVINSEALDIMKTSTSSTKDIIEKIAVIGVTGVKKIFADVVAKFSGTNIKYFDTREHALEWLLKE
jgi:dihydroxyacetone kinase DhaKLM complex PTS-EIIA-like component DhaM